MLSEGLSEPKLFLNKYLRYKLEWLEKLRVKIRRKISNLFTFITDVMLFFKLKFPVVVIWSNFLFEKVLKLRYFAFHKLMGRLKKLILY